MELSFWILLGLFFFVESALHAMIFRGYRQMPAPEGAYGADRLKAAWAGLTLQYAWTALLAAGGLAGLHSWLAGFPLDQGSWVSPAFAAALLTAGRLMAGLPLSLWSVYGIEARHGFNRTKPPVFWADQAKSLLLGGLMSAGLLAILVIFWESLNGWFFAAAPAAVFFLSVLLQVVWPYWVAPLFHRFTPLEEGALKARLSILAQRLGLKIRDIRVMNAAERTAHVNAYVSGFGTFQRIVLYDTLVKDFPVEEVEAVLAHEIGHWKKRHLTRWMFWNLAGLSVGFGALFLLAAATEGGRLFAGNASDRGFFLLAAVFVLPGLVFPLRPLTGWISRTMERQADRFAAEALGGPEPLIAALERLGRAGKVPFDPPKPLRVYATHPSLGERIRALRALGDLAPA